MSKNSKSPKKWNHIIDVELAAKRPSPSEHAKDNKNKVMRGNDGYMYKSLPNKNGIYRWVRYWGEEKYNIKNTLKLLKELKKELKKIGICLAITKIPISEEGTDSLMERASEQYPDEKYPIKLVVDSSDINYAKVSGNFDIFDINKHDKEKLKLIINIFEKIFGGNFIWKKINGILKINIKISDKIF